MSICYAKLYHRTKTKEGTIFLNVNNLPGQILPLKLINLRETGLNGLCPKESPYIWQRVGLLKGEKGSTYWCIPAIPNLYFLSLFSNFSFLFPLLFFSQNLFSVSWFFLEVTITVFVIHPPLPRGCMARILYIMPAMTEFYYFSL